MGRIDEDDDLRSDLAVLGQAGLVSLRRIVLAPPEVRTPVLRSLADRDDTRAIAPLLAQMAAIADSDRDARSCLLEAIGNAGSTSAREDPQDLR